MVLSILFLIVICLFFYKLNFVCSKETKINIPHKRNIGNAQLKGTKEFQNDYFSVEYNNEYILSVIADGLTDKSSGRYAAELSVNILRENFNKIDNYASIQEYFKNSFGDINEILNNTLRNKTGAVVLAAIIGKNFIEWAAIGNCALYLYENGEILKINNTESNLIEFGKMKFKKRHKILICTDGVYKSLCDKDIIKSMSEKISAYDKAIKMSKIIKCKSLKYQDNATLVIIE